jgi:hypothetical protein
MLSKAPEGCGQSGFGCVRVKGFAEFTAIRVPQLEASYHSRSSQRGGLPEVNPLHTLHGALTSLPTLALVTAFCVREL